MILFSSCIFLFYLNVIKIPILSLLAHCIDSIRFNFHFNFERITHKKMEEVTDHDFVFVDLQGFRTTNDEFILKEFCLINGGSEFVLHVNVIPPCDFTDLSSKYQRQAKWLTKFFHGIEFDSGFISLKEFIADVLPFVKEKKWS